MKLKELSICVALKFSYTLSASENSSKSEDNISWGTIFKHDSYPGKVPAIELIMGQSNYFI